MTIEHAARAGGSSGDDFEVLINGVVVATISPSTIGYFDSTTLTITGAAGTDVITFREMSGQNNGLGALLNGISLSPTQATVDSSGEDFNDLISGGAGRLFAEHKTCGR